jgi:hypothetical protein
MSDFLIDTFTESSTTDLSAHTPDVGGAWAPVTGLSSPISVLSTGYATGSTSAARNAAAPPSADYSVTVICRVGATGQFVGPIARASASAQTFYQAYIDSGFLYVAKYVAGNWGLLGSAAFSMAVNTDYAVTITVSGTSISASVGATTAGPFTDSSITDAGFAGFIISNGAGVNSIGAAGASEFSFTAPQDGIVRQLSSGASGTATISAAGTYTGSAPDQIRLVNSVGGAPVAGFDWSAIGAAAAGSFSHTFSGVPKGGWYRVQVRRSGGAAQSSGNVGAGVVVAVDGQSNAWLWFSSTAYAGDSSMTPNPLTRITGKQSSGAWLAPSSSTMNGAIACANALAEAMNCPVALVDGSFDGSGLTLSVNGGQWISGGGAGNAYTSSAAALAAAGGKCAASIWVQGESDAANAVTQSAYHTALFQMIDLRRAAVGDAAHPYVVVGLARNLGGAITDANWEAIKRAQAQAADSSNIYRVDRLDLPLIGDGTHHTAAGFTTLGRRCAQAVLAALGVASYHRGPRIESVMRVNPTTLDVNLTLNGAATTVTPPDSISGFRVLDGAAPVSITSATRQTSSRIRLVLASAPSSLPTVQYLYGTAPNITGAVKDNSALNLPLEYNAGVLATSAASSINLTLTTNGTTPAASLTGLKWAFFDQATPDALAGPVAKGVAESTNGSGVLNVDITGTTLSPGGVGWLIVTNSDGNPATNHSVFAGPVAVN